MVWVLSARKERRLRELELFRLNRRAAQEDVTVFGEELSQAQNHHLYAPDAYEAAKTGIRDARTRDDVRDVLRTLEGGRHPADRAPCFFDPTHGPSRRDVRWTPPNGVERDVPVCQQDLARLEAGDAPEPRRVRLGNRTLPWYAAGPAYQTYADGYFGRYVESGSMEAADLGTWADLGGSTSGQPGGRFAGFDGSGGGHDGSGGGAFMGGSGSEAGGGSGY